MDKFIMDRERHEELLSELLNPELETSKKTEILQELRNDHNSAFQGIKEMSKKNKELMTDNADLVVSNSKMFRQIGLVGTEKEDEIVEKDFSESVTVEELEKHHV